MKRRINGIWRDVYPPLWIITETAERTNFGFASGEAIRLLSIHDNFTNLKRGRPCEDLEALKRAALILTVVAWESFVECTAQRELSKRLRNAASPSDINTIFNSVAHQWLTPQPKPPDLAKWAGNGWKTQIKESLSEYLKTFNTPSSENVRTLFKRYVGLDVTQQWSWSRTPIDSACSQLDKLIRERGAAVHKARTVHPLTSTEPCVKRSTVVNALNLTYNLVDRTEHALGVGPSCYDPSK